MLLAPLWWSAEQSPEPHSDSTLSFDRIKRLCSVAFAQWATPTWNDAHTTIAAGMPSPLLQAAPQVVAAFDSKALHVKACTSDRAMFLG